MKSLATANPFKVLPMVVQAALVAACPLFRTEWFGQRTGNSGSRYRVARQFARDGIDGGAANPLFDAAWYQNRYGFRGTAAQSLLHYWLMGDRLGLRPTPWFDAGFFRRSHRAPGIFGTALMLFLQRWRDHSNAHPLFDQTWYLESYPDIRESGQNPLLHFVLYGQQEGRQPNPYFSPNWYLEKNQDVAKSGINPALHFCLYGAAEGRSPGPSFDAAAYLGRYPEVAQSHLDPLSHFLAIGRHRGADPGSRVLKVSTLSPRIGTLPTAEKAPVVDVVVPVYRGLDETRACIESVLASSSYGNVRLHLYNDASPEHEVADYLRDVKQRHPEVDLVENPENRGFVGTVNSAMRATFSRADFTAVILLNSDAEVANDWVERLFAHVGIEVDRVATVTALSNNATICSYPQIGENDLPTDCDTADLDLLAAQVNAGESVQIPTGVGFCMLITRQALDALGFFDEEAFGKGYGEEVDFCMRANQAGMRNLLAMDVFVRHIGEVSFADVSKPGKVIAQKILQERYPHFNSQVAAFVAVDPGLPARIRITWARWKRSGRPVHVLVSHACGGGTERRVQEVARSLGRDGHVVILRPAKFHSDRINVDNPSAFDGFNVEVEVESGQELADLLGLMGAQAIQIHHVLGFGEYLREGIALHGRGFDFIVHDYYSVCPQVTLTTRDSSYCREKGMVACDACIAERPSHGAADIRNWRLRNEWLVVNAMSVVAPSQDTAMRIAGYTGRHPAVQYHEPEIVGQQARPKPSQREFKVAIIGVLAPHKGRDKVLAMAGAAREKSLPLKLHLIGDTQGEVPRQAQKHLSATGTYREEDLDGLIAAADPDAFLFPAPWPETYSYTLSAALRTGRPIIASDIGAFRERLSDYHSAFLFPWDTSGEELAEHVVGYLRSLQEQGASVRTKHPPQATGMGK
ncbi:glycosyltransferase [Pseudoxanthomonas sp. LARHCG66]